MNDPVQYIPHFLAPDTAQACFDTLRDQLAWERREGAPRSEYWTNTFDRPYTYGRGEGQRTYQPQKSHLLIDTIRADLWIKYAVWNLEGCFLNYYETERDSLGWHSDDDPGIDHTRPIAVVTLGSPRVLKYRWMPGVPTDDVHSLATCRVELEPGSLLLMKPGMQQTHQHCIMKGDRQGSSRISLTYRGLVKP